MSLEASQIDVHFVFAVFMFPCFPHLHLHLAFINDCVSVHPALHVCLSSARAHITSLPPTSCSDDMLSSRDVFVRALGLLRLPPFTFKDTLSIGSECLCGHIFRFGFAPYNPFFVILKVIEALLLVFWAQTLPQEYSPPLLRSPKWYRRSSRSFEEGRCCESCFSNHHIGVDGGLQRSQNAPGW